MKINLAKISVLFGLLSIFSCNSVKKVPENAFLLHKNNISENGKKLTDEAALGYIQQQPNAHLLGLPLWLYTYNLADEKSEEKYFNWLKKRPKTRRFMEKLLSKKQVNRLGKSFLVSGKDVLLKKFGEAPVLLDTLKTHKTAQTLNAYFKSKGYFNSKTKYEITPIDKPKQASVSYEITTGKPYFVDSLTHRITSPELDSLYRQRIHERLLQPKKQYLLDDFVKERARLSELFRNNGFYNFQQEAINFVIERDTLVENQDSLINVSTEIEHFTERSQNSIKRPYQKYTLGRIQVFTDYDPANSMPYDTIFYKDIALLYRNKLKLRPKTIHNALSLHSGALYSDNNRGDTYRQLSNLRTFRSPNIQYTYHKGSYDSRMLDTNIYLTPLPKYGLESNTELTHSNIQAFGIGQSLALRVRNLLRGAETLEISAHGTIGSQQLFVGNNGNFFNVFEYGGDIRLTIPRIWFFLNTEKIIPKYTTPQTIFQLGTSFQKNIGLDRQKVQAVLRYSWLPKKKNRATLEFFDVEFIRNLNPENFFNVYESSYQHLNQIARQYPSITAPYLDMQGNLKRNDGFAYLYLDALGGRLPLTAEERQDMLYVWEKVNRLTRNDLIFATSFSYIWNNSIKYAERNFQQYRVKVETAGNFPQLLSQIMEMEKDGDGNKQFLGVSYAQYVKVEAEAIKHWALGLDDAIAVRAFAGIAIPYGNGRGIPFSRSYFAGGSNDNRGWKAYSLGPGGGESLWEFNEANLKISANFEYRFPIKKAFKGALFVDAGNIWQVFDENLFSNHSLRKFEDLKNIGIGTGLGFRYDFNYFIFRLDLGVKAYDPAKEINNRWIRHLTWSDPVLNIGINYPF